MVVRAEPAQVQIGNEVDMWRMSGLLICFSCPMAIAEPVDLLTTDGYVALSGDLVEVKNEFYVLNTSVGEVKVPVADVICKGAGCPASAVSSHGKPPSNGEDALKFTSSQVKNVENKKLLPDQKEELFQQYLNWRDNDKDSQDPNDELVVSRPIWERQK